MAFFFVFSFFLSGALDVEALEDAPPELQEDREARGR